MALAEHGIQLDPGALNRELKKRGGYTRRGWLKWDAVRQVTGGKVRIRIPGSPHLSEIDAALQAGNPVIAKVLLASGIHHWVLVVRREGKEYLIKDPLGNGRHLSKLSQFESGVLAIRIVEKAT